MRLLLRCRAGLLALALLLLFVVRARGDCGMPQVQFGELRNGSQLQNTYSIGTTLTFRCIAGHEYIPGIIPRLTCTPASEWEPKDTPFCRVVECPRPDIQNGSISAYQPSYSYDHALIVSCDEGYYLSGAVLIKCGADNNWHPPIPTCVPGVVPTISDYGSAPGAGPTQPPQPESNKTLAIALGLVGGLILVVLIASALYCKTHQSRGKSVSTGPPDSYHVVPQNTDIPLEEKKEPSQV
ncbi:hypothetical protein lerEdw1_012931 [Lerista edwardsae]|nr:hypothetical protein lerEdw1_012931 [Lerista edwardsae]